MSHSFSKDVAGPFSGETLLDSETEEDWPMHKSNAVARRRKKPWSSFTWSLITMVLTVFATLLLIVISRPRWLLAQYPEMERLASLNTYSPAYYESGLRLETVRQHGDLWWNTSKRYRQDPSPETDRAWKDLLGGSTNRMLVSKEDIEKAGIDPDTAVQWPDDPTGNTYIAELNVYHLLHCLDKIRRTTFLNYYHPMRPIDPFTWPHYYHCLDMIRQDIMCKASLDLVPLVWQQYETRPFPFFSIERQCMSWDSLEVYRKKHELTDHQIDVLYNYDHRISGTEELPSPSNVKPMLDNYHAWEKRNSSEDTWVEPSDYGRYEWDMMPPMRQRPHEQKIREKYRPHKSNIHHDP